MTKVMPSRTAGIVNSFYTWKSPRMGHLRIWRLCHLHIRMEMETMNLHHLVWGMQSTIILKADKAFILQTPIGGSAEHLL